jgi:hypothetical protein
MIKIESITRNLAKNQNFYQTNIKFIAHIINQLLSPSAINTSGQSPVEKQEVSSKLVGQSHDENIKEQTGQEELSFEQAMENEVASYAPLANQIQLVAQDPEVKRAFNNVLKEAHQAVQITINELNKILSGKEKSAFNELLSLSRQASSMVEQNAALIYQSLMGSMNEQNPVINTPLHDILLSWGKNWYSLMTALENNITKTELNAIIKTLANAALQVLGSEQE